MYPIKISLFNFDWIHKQNWAKTTFCGGEKNEPARGSSLV
jgi:hypothetical protein